MSKIPEYSLEQLPALNGAHAGYLIGSDYYIITVNEKSEPIGYVHIGKELPPDLASEAHDAVTVSSFEEAVNDAVNAHRNTLKHM